jgi:hypothetical protein
MKPIRKLSWLWLVLMSVAVYAEEPAEKWMPDTNLRDAVVETLELPKDVPLTKVHLQSLSHLEAWNSKISNLNGMENATNLMALELCGNQISDLSPLSDLVQIEHLSLCGNQISDISSLSKLTNLKLLDLGLNQISDIAPLANLTQLVILNIGSNLVEDITPLVNLKQLSHLKADSNQINDISSLAGLSNLKELILENNKITDVNPLVNLSQLDVLNIANNPTWNFGVLHHLNLTTFEHDTLCKIPSAPVEERLLTRSFPSVFFAWDRFIIPGISDKFMVLGMNEGIVYHDLAFSLTFGLNWQTTASQSTSGIATRVGGNLEAAQDLRDRHLALNPNIVTLVTIAINGSGELSKYPPNSDFWLRDDKGQIVYSEILNGPMINFMNSELQDIIIERIVGIAECGLYDGVMFDGFAWNATGFVGRDLFPHTNEEIIAATTRILREARNRVREDFLILINSGRSKPTAYAEYIDGSFMELGRDHSDGYTYRELVEIEDILLWNELNLRSPQINCLEGEGIGTEPPDSPENQRWMRLFTTLGLTHSNGYVLYNTGKRFRGGPDHEHIWYDFWDADLGKPVDGTETKGQLYDNRDGVFIREFTEGWAVYNRSGQTQSIEISMQATGVHSGITSTQHTVPDLDGEIFLKKIGPSADVNGDGRVNILDLW